MSNSTEVVSGSREWLASLGFAGDEIEYLLDRLRSNPRLVGLEYRGKWVNLQPPNPDSQSRLRQMLEDGSVPAIMTDAVFLRNHCNGSQFEKTPHLGDFYAREAREMGVDPKGKVYLSGLAEYPGDPRAWVESRGDVERLARERGYGVQGSVNVKAPDSIAPPPEPGIDPEIVEGEVASLVADSPEPAKVNVPELREQVRAKRKPNWAK